MNLIAGKAIALSKANTEEFKNYFVQANKNAQSLFASLKDLGISMIGDRTDTHLVLLDVFKTYGIAGDVAAKFLEDAHIISNKNVIPHDANDPSTPSGIILGTLSLTTLGFKEDDFM